MLCTHRKLMVVMGMLVICSPMLTSAQSTSGRRNTAFGLGAATIYHAAKGHTGEAVAFGLGTAYAWQRYEKARKQERARSRASTVDTYSAERSAGESSSTHAADWSNRHHASASGASSAGSLRTQLAALKEQTEIRQAAMQQNLNELAAKTESLEKRNKDLTSQLTGANRSTSQAQRQSLWYLGWALLASVISLAISGGLAYYFLHQRGRLAGGTFSRVRA